MGAPRKGSLGESEAEGRGSGKPFQRRGHGVKVIR